VKRRTHAEIRLDAHRERDHAIAALVARYAALVEKGLPCNPLRYDAEIREPLVTALMGLSSSIRAGLIE
jgi:hypothetical protein